MGSTRHWWWALALSACATPPALPPGAAGAASEWSAPAYASPVRFVELPFEVGMDPWKLGATLTLPRGVDRPPVVLLVPGDGAVDRDGTIGPNKPFKDIAWGLGSRGIATLRYDKRSFRYPDLGRRLGNRLTVQDETLDDVHQALGALALDPRLGDIFVLGHSMGGTLVPRIALRDRIATGFVIVAGATRPLEDVLVDQLRHVALLDGTIDAREERLLGELRAKAERVKHIDRARPPAAGTLPLGLPAGYWLDLGQRPVATLAPLVDRPLLVLRGDRDYQCTAADFEGWRRLLGGRAGYRRYPALNHLMMPSSEPPSPTDYNVPGHVSEQVIADVAGWISSIGGPKPARRRDAPCAPQGPDSIRWGSGRWDRARRSRRPPRSGSRWGRRGSRPRRPTGPRYRSSQNYSPWSRVQGEVESADDDDRAGLRASFWCDI